MSDSYLKSKAVSGAVWVAVEKTLRQIVLFVFGIILARILDPSDYGIVGMLAIFMAIASTFQDSGLCNALIQKQNRDEKDYSTVFFFNLIVSCLCYILLFCISPAIAKFYHIPILKDVTRVMALQLIIVSFSAVNIARLTIGMKFKEQSVISIVSTVLGGAVGLFLAYSGKGVWALVFQGITSAMVTVLLSFFATRWVPSSGFSRNSFKQLFGFGSKLLGSSLINTLYNNLYTLVIGRVFSPEQVGYYNRGNQYALLPVQTFQDLTQKVNFPILATVQDDNVKLLGYYRKLMTMPLYILYPVLIGIAAVSEPLITVMIGEKWLPCVKILQVLCIGYMFSPLSNLNLNLLYVKGRTDLVLKLELIKKPIGFAILIASIPFGIIWMVVGKAFYEFVAFSINCHYTKKLLGYGELEQLKSLIPIFVKSLVMGCIVTVVMIPCQSSWMKLGVGISTGIVSYILLSILTNDSCFIALKDIVIDKIRKH